MTAIEQELYLQQEARIDEMDFSYCPLWFPGAYNLISDEPSERWIEFLKWQIERNKK